MYNEKKEEKWEFKRIEKYVERESSLLNKIGNPCQQFIEDKEYDTIIKDEKDSNNNSYSEYLMACLGYRHKDNGGENNRCLCEFVAKVKDKKVHQLIEEGVLPKDNIYKFLFLSIYQVRCNLFHGNKYMDGERDKRLVKEGATILKTFLNKWMD